MCVCVCLCVCVCVCVFLFVLVGCWGHSFPVLSRFLRGAERCFYEPSEERTQSRHVTPHRAACRPGPVLKQDVPCFLISSPSVHHTHTHSHTHTHTHTHTHPNTHISLHIAI